MLNFSAVLKQKIPAAGVFVFRFVCFISASVLNEHFSRFCDCFVVKLVLELYNNIMVTNGTSLSYCNICISPLFSFILLRYEKMFDNFL